MFFGIPQPYIIDIYGFYFEEYMPGYLPATTNIKNNIMPPPGRGNGSDPELLDSPIGLFHYPSPGALLRLLGHFIFI